MTPTTKTRRVLRALGVWPAITAIPQPLHRGASYDEELLAVWMRACTLDCDSLSAVDDGISLACYPTAGGARLGACSCGGCAMDGVGNASFTQQDAVEFLRSLPSGSADLILTDPAYESLEKHRATGTTTRLKHSKSSSNDWFSIFPNSRFPEFFAECFRVLKRDSHFYLFCDQETMFVAKPLAEAAGFRFWKPIVWHKAAIGMGYHYRACYEFVLFFEKGRRRLKNLGTADVLGHDLDAEDSVDLIKVKRIKGTEAYPTEKPVELLEVFVQQSTNPGELVIDPFFGSGSTAVAALKHGCNFRGADISPAAFAHATVRVHGGAATEKAEEAPI